MLLKDMAVVMKPASWQVDTDDIGTPIHRFTQWVHRRFQRAPVCHSHHHRYGIIHRLDTPSSGLICVGRTFEGYFSLMFQLSIGQLARDYIVLGFNTMEPQAKLVDSKMFQWKQAGPVCVQVSDEVGKLATTWLSAVGHARHTWAELSSLWFSVVAIRIGTGRRHQIRTHITHIGHPTVLDAKYADSSVTEPQSWKLERWLVQERHLGVPFPPLDSKRFRSVFPQHVGVEPETLNPALLQLLGSTQSIPAAGSRPGLMEMQLKQPKTAGSPEVHGPWSRDGPCSRSARRVDAEGRDRDRCMVCGEFGHWSRECPNGGKNRCLVCGKMGHRARNCPEGCDICSACGKVGHLDTECPQLHPGTDPWKPQCFDFKLTGNCRFGKQCPFTHPQISHGKAGAR